MTRFENLWNYLNRKPYEWIPTTADYRFFMPEEICENVVRGFVAQQEPFDRSKFGGYDFFGVHWTFQAEAAGMGGSLEDGKLFDDINDWPEKVVFPDLDAIDWEGCAKRNANYINTDKILQTTIFTGFFERLISFIGFEEAAAAMVDEDCEDSVKALFDKLADFYIELIKRMKKYLNIQYVDFHDDWGTQRSPIFSPATHRNMIMPYMKKVIDGAHENGVIFGLHSCGMIEPMLPNMIEMGVDTWRGQEINDIPKLVEMYGDKFTFDIFTTVSAIFAGYDEFYEAAKATFEKYKGKHVLYSFPRWYSEEEHASVIKMLEEMQKQ